MTFTGDESEVFPLSTAAQWTKNYRTKYPNGMKAHFFGMNPVKTVLQQTGCVGFRIYYALDDAGVQQLILVGVDASGNDLYNGIILERAIPCPPYCDSGASPLLNS